MKIDKSIVCDIFVAGAGIAGIMAAITAAQQGKKVIIASSTHLFSGSSFYPGTWGLGLIGPENDQDVESLVQSILQVGCGMADEEMVRTFVEGITPAIEYVKKLGVKLKTAQDNTQKEFIPCFDHKKRGWNGILFDSAREVFQKTMEDLHVCQMPDTELLEILVRGGKVQGAVVRTKQEILGISCSALVLATGGYGGLFEHRLTTDDVCGMGQYLALQQGCTLVNMEYMQMMPGYLSPCYKTIFNEKTFRFTELSDGDGQDLMARIQPGDRKQKLLEQRSGYGPFTSRLESREVDFAILRGEQRCKDGVTVTYRQEMKEHMPEFVKTYFDWLKEKKNLTPDDPVHIGMFAHAANGGIKIRPDASTGVTGLFACGEVTGGMHGADRIGGLSTANGLVFGRKAGDSAAAWVDACTRENAETAEVEKGKAEATKTVNAARAAEKEQLENINFDMRAVRDADSIRKKLQHLMTENAMVIRSGQRLETALESIRAIRAGLEYYGTEDLEAICQTRRLEAQLTLSEGILMAEKLRTESRGSHFREDFPEQNPEFTKCIVLNMEHDICKAEVVR